MGGGYFCSPPLIYQELPVRFTKFKWRSIDQENLRKHNVVDPRVTDDVTGQVKFKFKMFDDLAYLVLSRVTAVQNENKPIQQHGSCLGHFYSFFFKSLDITPIYSLKTTCDFDKDFSKRLLVLKKRTFALRSVKMNET